MKIPSKKICQMPIHVKDQFFRQFKLPTSFHNLFNNVFSGLHNKGAHHRTISSLLDINLPEFSNSAQEAVT